MTTIASVIALIVGVLGLVLVVTSSGMGGALLIMASILLIVSGIAGVHMRNVPIAYLLAVIAAAIFVLNFLF